MSIPTVQIGDIWERKIGARVRITEARESRGLTHYKMVPIGHKGRTSWKWDAAIRSELTFVSSAEPAE